MKDANKNLMHLYYVRFATFKYVTNVSTILWEKEISVSVIAYLFERKHKCTIYFDDKFDDANLFFYSCRVY